MPEVPRNVLTWEARYWNPSRLLLTVQGRLVGRQYDDDQNTLLLNRFYTMDLQVGRAINRHLEPFAAAENLLDERYQVARTPIVISVVLCRHKQATVVDISTCFFRVRPAIFLFQFASAAQKAGDQLRGGPDLSASCLGRLLLSMSISYTALANPASFDTLYSFQAIAFLGHEWTDGYTNRFALFYVNYATLERTPKLSAHFYLEVIAHNAVVRPDLRRS